MNKIETLRSELEKARKKLNDAGKHFNGDVNSIQELMNAKPFEIAYQDVIERIWPDAMWWQVTGYWDIFDAMMGGLSDEEVIDEICKHVGKDYLRESACDRVNGACVEFNHNIKEYMSKFGDAYDNGELWDFSKEDFENGAIDVRDDITYWYMRDLSGDWRYFETDIKCEKEAVNEEKKLDEGTSNFGSLDNFPLLVFYTYDEFDYNVKHHPDYPQEDQFEDEDGNVDYDALEQAQYDFEEKAWEDEKVCVLDEDSVERLKDKLYDFNEETKRMAWDADVVDGEQQYGYNLNLEDVMLDIEPGYYEAAYINVEHEDYLDDLEDDFKAQQMERFNKFFDEIKKEFGLTELNLAYRASNGETGYNIVKDESLKESKSLSTEEFLNWHDGDGGRHASMQVLNSIYDIFKENGCSEEDDVDVCYDACSDDDKLRISDIIRNAGESLEEKKDKKAKVRFCGDPAREAEFFNHTMGNDKNVEVSDVSLGEEAVLELDDMDDSLLNEESLNEGRYADISKRLAIAEKELKELKAKYDAETDESKKDEIGDDIMWKETEIGDLKGALAEIRYLDNGSASDYSGYESLEEDVDDKESTIYIKYWEDEDLRDQGISEIYLDSFNNVDEAKAVARKLIDRDGFASVEVMVAPSGSIESEDDYVVWGYDGIDTWGKDKEESLDESRGKGFVCKYKGYNIIDAGDRYVITNKNGLNVGESKFGLPVVKGIIDDFDDVEESLKESSEVAREEYCVIVDGNNESCYDTEEEAIKYARKRFAEKGNDSVVKVLLVKYGSKDEHGDEPELGVETIWASHFEESLKEGADDVYSLHVKVLDTHSGRPIKVDRIMVGSRKECMDKKKQLEETSPEDSYHNRNVYTVSKVK